MTLVILLTSNTGCNQFDPPEKPRTLSFDQGWQFIKANPTGAETPGFDDTGWRTLDLPHDWSIEDLPADRHVRWFQGLVNIWICKFKTHAYK
jgi:hypothetical protein